MIRLTINIITAFFALLILSCQKESSVNAKETILKYSLKNSYNNRYSSDSTLLFNLYENLKTNHFLYIAQNKNSDTIFKFFDSTKFELRVRDFFKYKNNYFISLWDSNLKNYVGYDSDYKTINKSHYEDLFRYDSLNIHKVDTLSYELTKIKKPTLDNVKEFAVKNLNLKGSFNVVKSGSELRLVKDTLKNYKIINRYDVGLELKKIDRQNYYLEPYFFNKNKVLINEDDFSIYQYAFLKSTYLQGIIKYYTQYDSLFNQKGYSKIDFLFKKNNEEHTIHTSLQDLFPDKNIRDKYIDNKTALNIETFKYKNGEWFLRIYQDLNMRDYLEPQIYHLDTENWKINNVLLYDKGNDKIYKRLKQVNEIEIFSGIHKSTLYYLLKDYEIVKLDDDYKLIRK